MRRQINPQLYKLQSLQQWKNQSVINKKYINLNNYQHLGVKGLNYPKSILNYNLNYLAVSLLLNKSYSYQSLQILRFGKHNNQVINNIISENKNFNNLNINFLIWNFNKLNKQIHLKLKFYVNKNKKKWKNKFKKWAIKKKRRKGKNKWSQFKATFYKFNTFFYFRGFQQFYYLWKPNIFNRRDKQLAVLHIFIWRDGMFKYTKFINKFLINLLVPLDFFQKRVSTKFKRHEFFLTKERWWKQNYLYYLNYLKQLQWNYLYLYWIGFLFFKNKEYFFKNYYKNFSFKIKLNYNKIYYSRYYSNYFMTYGLYYYKLKLILLKNYSINNWNFKIWKLKYKNIITLNKIKLKWMNKLISLFTRKIRTMWRKNLMFNLLLIYIIIFQYKIFFNLAEIFGNYSIIQLRIIFLKHNQRRFFFLILEANKFFIKNNKYIIQLYYNFHLLNANLLIITGRWQRRRWAAPFPLKFNIGLRISVKLQFFNYWQSYFQGDIYNKKGNIAIRIFLIGNKINEYLLTKIAKITIETINKNKNKGKDSKEILSDLLNNLKK